MSLGKVARKAGQIAVAVIHDKNVQRSAKSLAVLIAVRVAIAAGASAEVVDLIKHLAS